MVTFTIDGLGHEWLSFSVLFTESNEIYGTPKDKQILRTIIKTDCEITETERRK